MNLFLRLKILIVRVGYLVAWTLWTFTRPSSQGVLCFVFDSRHRLLLLQNTYRPWYWSLPGGGIHRGEAKENACRREVWEETGLKNLVDFTFLGSVLVSEEYKKDTVFLYTAKTKSEKLNTDPFEIKTASWYPLDQLPSNLSETVTKGLPLVKIHYAR